MRIIKRCRDAIIFFRYNINTRCVESLDSLIRNSERCAKLAEEVGLDEYASTYRKGNRLYRELKDDLARIGEEV